VAFSLNNTSVRGVEWAPEVAYAVFNNLAVATEFPFEDSELEAYKMAVQWTMGVSENNKFIHGIQIIAETLRSDDLTELCFLYGLVYRFNTVWSAIGLFGVILEKGVDAAYKDNTILLNASVFANVNKNRVIGLELNNTDPTLQKIDDNEMTLLILPQAHYEFDSGWAFQIGFGPNIKKDDTDVSGVLRVIKSF
jgi:hypothetical protein